MSTRSGSRRSSASAHRRSRVELNEQQSLRAAVPELYSDAEDIVQYVDRAVWRSFVPGVRPNQCTAVVSRMVVLPWVTCYSVRRGERVAVGQRSVTELATATLASALHAAPRDDGTAMEISRAHGQDAAA